MDPITYFSSINLRREKDLFRNLGEHQRDLNSPNQSRNNPEIIFRKEIAETNRSSNELRWRQGIFDDKSSVTGDSNTQGWFSVDFRRVFSLEPHFRYSWSSISLCLSSLPHDLSFHFVSLFLIMRCVCLVREYVCIWYCCGVTMSMKKNDLFSLVIECVLFF